MVNPDGTINIKEAWPVLQEMGLVNLCFMDNDCACSDAMHEKQIRIEQEFLKRYG